LLIYDQISKSGASKIAVHHQTSKTLFLRLL